VQKLSGNLLLWRLLSYSLRKKSLEVNFNKGGIHMRRYFKGVILLLVFVFSLSLFPHIENVFGAPTSIELIDKELTKLSLF